MCVVRRVVALIVFDFLCDLCVLWLYGFGMFFLNGLYLLVYGFVCGVVCVRVLYGLCMCLCCCCMCLC